MNTPTVILLAVTLCVAAIDWYAVQTGNLRLEYVAKPATMVPLIAAAFTIDAVDSSMRTWFVVALVLSLAGDVFLMLPNEDLFVMQLPVATSTENSVPKSITSASGVSTVKPMPSGATIRRRSSRCFPARIRAHSPRLPQGCKRC